MCDDWTVMEGAPERTDDEIPGSERGALDVAWEALCGDARGATARRLFIGLLTVTYVCGALGWFEFLNHGQIPFTHGDWAERMHFYYSVIHESLTLGHVPFFVSQDMTFGHYETNLFLAVPELPFSPQFLLLRILGPGEYVLANTLLLYSIGFWGCVLLARRLRLSLVSLIALVLLFNFNGHLLGHLNAGHASWGGFFFLPYFFLFVNELVEDPRSRSNVAQLKIALVLGAMMLQGGVHIVVWCVLFLGLLAITTPATIAKATGAAVLGLLLSGFGLIPAAVVFWGYSRSFYVGFQNPGAFVEALVGVPAKLQANPLFRWEYDTFIGFVAVSLIVVFGFGESIRRLRASRAPALAHLLLPAAVFAIFTFGDTYRILYESRLPVLTAERVPSRFLVIAVLALLLVSLVQFNDALQTFRHRSVALVLVVLGLAATTAEIVRHSAGWAFARGSGLVQPAWLTGTIHVASPWQENLPYTVSLLGGVTLSALTLVLIFARWKSVTSEATNSKA